jgi:AdoMet-dependent heme synthase
MTTIQPPQLDTIHFNSTKTCNLGCKFCYDKAIRGKTENLRLEIIEQVADDAAALGAKRVILSGGEPLARADWQAVAKIFSDAEMEVSLATNGTLLSESAVFFLKSLANVSVSISLDGGQEVHDELRDQRGAFQRTLRGMHRLHSAGIKFDVNATIIKKNIKDVPILTKIARDYRCTMRLSLLHPNGRGEQIMDESVSTEQIMQLREYCHVLRKQSGINIFVNLPPLLQYLDEIIPGRGAACGWASNFCGILSNGDVSICGVASDEPDLVAGNVNVTRFREIWVSSPLFKYTRALKTDNLKGICGRCPFNSICGGACRLSAFREKRDFLGEYALCQNFYDAGYIPEEILDAPKEEVDRAMPPRSALNNDRSNSLARIKVISI